jgi:hypothetical protein
MKETVGFYGRICRLSQSTLEIPAKILSLEREKRLGDPARRPDAREPSQLRARDA